MIEILMIYLALIYFLQIIVVTLYEQLAVRLCLTSIATIALTGNYIIKGCGEALPTRIHQSSCNAACRPITANLQ